MVGGGGAGVGGVGASVVAGTVGGCGPIGGCDGDPVQVPRIRCNPL